MSSDNKPPECKPFSSDLAAEMKVLFPVAKDGFIRVGEKDYVHEYRYRKCADEIYNFRFRPDDVCLCNVPRSDYAESTLILYCGNHKGTTVTKELVWLIANDMNFEEARNRRLTDRFTLFEADTIMDYKNITDKYRSTKSIRSLLDSETGVRFISTHLAFSLIPNILESNCKIIYVMRNPKDVLVSFYHYHKANKTVNYQGDFPKFCDYFMRGLILWTPYMEHIKEAWAQRRNPNVLIIFYENIVNNIHETIRQISSFLGKSYNDEEIAKLAKHVAFKEFQKNPMVNRLYRKDVSMFKPEDFIRRGKAGGWKDSMSPEIVAKMDHWISENLKGTDLVFPNDSD